MTVATLTIQGVPAIAADDVERTAPASPPAESAASISAKDAAADLDRALIRRAQAGDEPAFAELVERYSTRAYWIALHMVNDRDEARDIAQEAFIRVFRSIGRFKLEYKFYTWLYQIVTRLAIDALRKRSSQRRVSLDDVGEGVRSRDRDPHGELEVAEMKERVGLVLDELPPKYKAVMVLREIEGFSAKEIAGMVGSTHATVRWRLHRARALFRTAWERRFAKR